jgi:hypothetical protein
MTGSHLRARYNVGRRHMVVITNVNEWHVLRLVYTVVEEKNVNQN